MSFESTLIDYVNLIERSSNIRPLFLGGVTSSGGGDGGPPGGFVGYLPQTRVAYDLSELATLDTAISGASLLDNLNHIRYRIETVEITLSGGVGIEEAPIDSNLYGRIDGDWQEIVSSGDMAKAVYDTDDDGVVDNSEKLGGILPEYLVIDGGLAPDVPTDAEHITSLLHFDGEQDSTTFTDEKGATWTAYGNAKLDTVTKKFGSAAGKFDGDGDYISATLAATGTADFAKTFQIYPTSLPDNPYSAPFFSSNGTLWYGTGIILAQRTGGQISLWSPDGSDHYDPVLTTDAVVSINTWHHISLVRASNVFSIYIDGVKDINTVELTHNLTSTAAEIGRAVIYVFGPATKYFTGYVDEGISYDYAKYTEDFVPPITATESAAVLGNDILFKRGLDSNLPVLEVGEPYFALDTEYLYMGTGLEEIRIINDAPIDGNQYVRQSGTWVSISGSIGGVEEAPVDGTPYARQDVGWVAAGSVSSDLIAIQRSWIL